LADEPEYRFVLAELNYLLTALAPVEFSDAIEEADLTSMSCSIGKVVPGPRRAIHEGLTCDPRPQALP
jgi:hypothetical protein